MAKTPKNTKYFSLARGGYFFDPPESVFVNAFNKNLTNKQLADKFFALLSPGIKLLGYEGSILILSLIHI